MFRPWMNNRRSPLLEAAQAAIQPPARRGRTDWKTTLLGEIEAKNRQIEVLLRTNQQLTEANQEQAATIRQLMNQHQN